MPLGAVVGTSSLRRACQIKRLRPDITIATLRGNVPTRIQKMADGQFDAIVLAKAGLHRLNITDFHQYIFSMTEMLPAVGQGIITVECRANDSNIQALLTPLDCSVSRLCAAAERALVETLQGGCQLPISAYATLENEQLFLRGLVGDPEGTKIVSSEWRGDIFDSEIEAARAGVIVAKQLLEKGADKILAELL